MDAAAEDKLSPAEQTQVADDDAVAGDVVAADDDNVAVADDAIADDTADDDGAGAGAATVSITEEALAAAKNEVDVDKALAAVNLSKDGLQDMQKMFLALGLPLTRIIFEQMVEAAGLAGAEKDVAMRAIAGMSPLTEVCCMRVDFNDGAPDTAYIVFDRCPREHDVGAQLARLQRRLPPEKWNDILKNVSFQLHMIRMVYGNLARDHSELIRTISGGAPEKYFDLFVDPATSLLYVDAAWPNRVGIFVWFAAEVDPGK
jgi:hypothetical protein